ncbi:hypothetical protein D9M72_486070 [compost metagenome]
MLSTPAGMPACCASHTSASAVSGVSSAGLATTVQPAASAGAILRAIIASGKFHGVIAATTPTGSFSTSSLRPGTASATISPQMRVASSANHSTYDAPYCTSPRASFRGLPCSVEMMRARSSWCARISACQRLSNWARSRAGRRLQAGKAAAAASTARRASPASLSGTLAKVSPVAGSATCRRAPRPASHHRSSIRFWLRSSACSESVSISVWERDLREAA